MPVHSVIRSYLSKTSKMSMNPKGRYVPIMSTNNDANKRPMNVLSDQSNSQCISKYFKGTKGIVKPPEFDDATTSKRLQAKYDNFSNQPINIPEKIPFPKFGSKRENEPRNDHAQRTADAQEFNPPPNKTQKRHSTNADGKSLNAPVKTIRSSMIHLIGTVESAMIWYKTLRNAEVHVIYNVIGKFINVVNGVLAYEKYVFIRGMNTGCVLECRYFEVNHPLPPMIKGQQVACLGHVTGEQKFSLYNMYVTDETTNLDIQRAIFLSQRTVSEYSDPKFRY